jgi:hypothetical protein
MAVRFSHFTTSAQGLNAARGEAMTALTGLPAWARAIVFVLALPGICLIALSLVFLLASIATLLLLTIPAYSLLRRLVGPKRIGGNPGVQVARQSRRVDATVVN